jgi:hypothetical protein
MWTTIVGIVESSKAVVTGDYENQTYDGDGGGHKNIRC